MAAADDNRYDLRDGPRDRSLRVGDRERDAVGEILRRRHVEGRLNTEEFQARLERSLAAKTYADLDELVADFPRDGAERRPSPAFRLPLLILPLALVGALFVAGHAFWLAVPLLLFFVLRPLAWRGGRRGYLCGPFGPRRAMRL